MRTRKSPDLLDARTCFKNLETEQAKQQAFDKGEEGAVAPDPEVSQGIRTELAEIEQQLPEAVNRQTEKKQIFESSFTQEKVMASRAAPTEEVSDIEEAPKAQMQKLIQM